MHGGGRQRQPSHLSSSAGGALRSAGLRPAQDDAPRPLSRSPSEDTFPRLQSRAKELRERGWRDGWLLVPELSDAGDTGDFAAWREIVDLYEPAMSVRECVVGGGVWKERMGWERGWLSPLRRFPLLSTLPRSPFFLSFPPPPFLQVALRSLLPLMRFSRNRRRAFEPTLKGTCWALSRHLTRELVRLGRSHRRNWRKRNW